MPPPPRLSMSTAYMSYLNDPFVRELYSLRVQASEDEELVACHIYVTHAFWSLIVLETLQTVVHARIPNLVLP